MNFVAAKCPSCQGDLQIPDDREFVKCMYCGSEIKVREVLSVNLTANTKNLLQLANDALASQNWHEAYDYFTKVLEYQLDSSQAWFGKGLAACGLSTLTNNKLKEISIDLQNAMKYCEDAKKEEFKKQVVKEIFVYLNRFYLSVNGEINKSMTGGNPNTYDYNIWNTYIYILNDLCQIFDFCNSFYPDNKSLIKYVIGFCKASLKGFSSEYINRNVRPNRYDTWNLKLTGRNNEYMVDKLWEYEGLMEKLEPKPEPRVESKIEVNENSKVYISKNYRTRNNIIAFIVVSIIVTLIILAIVSK